MLIKCLSTNKIQYTSFLFHKTKLFLTRLRQSFHLLQNIFSFQVC